MAHKGYKRRARFSWQKDPLGALQRIWNRSIKEMLSTWAGNSSWKSKEQDPVEYEYIERPRHSGKSTRYSSYRQSEKQLLNNIFWCTIWQQSGTKRSRGWKISGPSERAEKIWNVRATVTLVVIGALGAIPKKLKKGLQDLGIGTKIVELQKIVIIHTARALRKVLEVWRGLLPPNQRT